MSDGAQPSTIVTVDDTMANLRLLTDMLRQHDYIVRGYRAPKALHEGHRAATSPTVASRASLADIPGVHHTQEHRDGARESRCRIRQQ